LKKAMGMLSCLPDLFRNGLAEDRVFSTIEAHDLRPAQTWRRRWATLPVWRNGLQVINRRLSSAERSP